MLAFLRLCSVRIPESGNVCAAFVLFDFIHSDPSEMLLDANSLQAQRKELLDVAGSASDAAPAAAAKAKKSGGRRALPVGSAVIENNGHCI